LRNRHRLYRLIALASGLWWFGIAFYYAALRTPHPLAPAPFFEIYKMNLVRDMAPWMMLPFVAAALLRLMSTRRGAKLVAPPIWLTWACGASALLWTGFALWRAHDQAVTCAVWSPVDALGGAAACSLPQMISAVSLWLAIPIAAWLLLAAAPRRSAAAALLRPNP
jgi:hypothetical protein